MSDTQRLIAALKENEQALREPLRKRFWEIDAAIKDAEKPLRDLQAQRDTLGDNVTVGALRQLEQRIIATRDALLGGGMAELIEERRMILATLRDGDGKQRLGKDEASAAFEQGTG